MQQHRDKWTEIEIYRNGHLFRRWWKNPQSLIGWNHDHRYAGELYTVITYGSGEGGWVHQYETVRGRMQSRSSYAMPDISYHVLINKRWWYLDDPNLAEFYLTGACAQWSGAEWEIKAFNDRYL